MHIYSPKNKSLLALVDRNIEDAFKANNIPSLKKEEKIELIKCLIKKGLLHRSF